MRLAAVRRTALWLNRPPEVMAQQAQDLLESLCHTDSPADRTWRYQYDTGYLRHVRDTDPLARPVGRPGDAAADRGRKRDIHLFLPKKGGKYGCPLFRTEQKAWHQLWTDVAALLKKTRDPRLGPAAPLGRLQQPPLGDSGPLELVKNAHLRCKTALHLYMSIFVSIVEPVHCCLI
jgi:hypothetical protein